MVGKTKASVIFAIGSVALAGFLAACGSTSASGSSTGSAKTTTAPTSSKAAPASSSTALRTVTLRLASTPTGFEAPFVYGVTSGIYKKFGLNVKWSWGNGSGITVEYVGANKAMFGDGTSTAVLQANAQGEHVVGVFGFMQQSANAIVVLKSSPIKSAKDMAGKTFGTTTGGAPPLLLPAVLKKVGIPVSAVHVDNMSPSAELPALVDHKVDGLLAFGVQVQEELQPRGIPVRLINYSQYGASTINLLLVTNEQLIQTHPKLVKAFVAATQEAVLASEQHPNAAAKAVVANAKGLSASEPVILSQWKSTIPMLQTANDKGHAVGWMSAKDWQETATLSQQYLGIKKIGSISQAYTNQFVPNTPASN